MEQSSKEDNKAIIQNAKDEEVLNISLVIDLFLKLHPIIYYQ